MTRLFLSVLLCFAVLPARAVEMLRPDQLKSGMKGYGLSVFKGTKPERFEVEILGVLKNAMPKQDMILIRTSGMDLEKHKVIAGMSGSPIYIDGKLIGALAYGWTFENEPIAGVTPIQNMLAELGKQPVAAPAAGNYGTPQPLLTPLALGGFSAHTIEMFADKLAGFGFVPAATGGGGDASRGTGRYEAGGAIGVQLIRGDLNATGVGTVTYVDGRRVLGFGHPMFHSGQILAPTCEAEVHTILSSMERSFKMASPIAELGALVGDWQSCIVADTQAKASMIPINVEAVNRATGDNETYKLEVIDNPMFSPLLAQMAVAEAVNSASGSSRDTTVHMTMEAQLTANNRDRTVIISDTYFNPNGGGLLSRDLLQPVAAVFQSPFGNPQVKHITVKVSAEQTRQTAEIRRAFFSKAQVDRGEHVLVSVVLKPFGKDEVTKTIEVEAPAATDSMKVLAVSVLAGNDAPPDLAPPDNLGDYLDAIEKQHHATDLVLLIQTPSQGLQYRGKLLKKLPASVLGVLDDDSRRDIRGAADVQQIVAPTDWVLTGQASVHVPIRQE